MAEIELPKQVQDKLIQFENLQRQLQVISFQKQQLLRQSLEIKNALEELEKMQKGKIYKISGSLVIETTKEESKKKLTEEKDTIEVRVKMFEKEEKKLTDKLNELRKEVQEMVVGLQKGNLGQEAG